MLDGFLEILNGGKAAILGESTDATFGKKHAMGISDFTLSSAGSGSKKKKKKKGQKGKPEAFEDEDDDEEDEGSGSKLLSGWNDLGSATDSQKQRKFALTFEVSKELDLGSPELFMAYCYNATNSPVTFDSAKVTLRKASGSTPLVYLVFEFTEVRVASFELEAGSGDKPPKEKLAFTFKTCTMQYRPQKSPGLASAKITGWDFEAGEPTG